MSKHHVSMLFLTLLNSACSFIGIRREETPAYKILEKEDNKEIREYQPYIKASVTVSGSYDDAVELAFKKLAGYIFGKNKKQKPLPMTAPVLIKTESQPIPMTAPVLIQQTNDLLTMSFIMPAKFTLQELPIPDDHDISFATTEKQLFAVIRFNGRISQKTHQKHQKELSQWLRQFKSYKENGTGFFAGYDPPWTIPFLRRNEVMIPLTIILK